ncbi:TIGR03618 family F420-dependent PPOX class oxidoreductase [Crossiella equi]|nr:TIGR03618 family F420-dependent PPOX class oxidoreductase [Crossiella equi]
MTDQERADFLAEPRVAILAVARGGRGPLAVPVWFDFRDGELLVWTRAGSRKAALIRAAGRCTLSVQQPELPYRYVTAEGPAHCEPDPSREALLAIVTRYLPQAQAQEYVDSTRTPDAVLVRMRPESWLSAGYGETG